jgi:hypothetical protein
MAASVLPANACRAARPLPTRDQVASVAPPRAGFVGKVASTRTTNEYGGAIVQVDVTESFGEKLPPVIHVVNPGCCVCVSIGGERGQQVTSIVRRGDDGLYHLDY